MTQQPLTRIGHPPGKKSGRFRPWMLLTAAAVLVAVAAVIWLTGPQPVVVSEEAEPSFAPQPFSVSGFMTLELGKFVWDGAIGADRCAGYKGYDDIKSGTQVLITDPEGRTIGLGSLGDGLPRRDPDDISRVTECRFPFKVTGIPGGYQFYSIEIGRRGKLTYARDTLGSGLELHLN